MDGGEHQTVFGAETGVTVAELDAEQSVSRSRHRDGLGWILARGERVADVQCQAEVGLAHGVDE